MALSYGLKIETDLKSNEIMKFISTLHGFEWGEGDSSRFLFGSGVMLSASQANNESQSITEEAFSFKPSVYIGFRINRAVDSDCGELTMLQVTSEIMQQLSGDCVLLYNGEIIVLQRLQNKLLLNQDYGVWTEPEFAAIKIPYELKSLPSPLL